MSHLVIGIFHLVWLCAAVDYCCCCCCLRVIQSPQQSHIHSHITMIWWYLCYCCARGWCVMRWMWFWWAVCRYTVIIWHCKCKVYFELICLFFFFVAAQRREPERLRVKQTKKKCWANKFSDLSYLPFMNFVSLQSIFFMLCCGPVVVYFVIILCFVDLSSFVVSLFHSILLFFCCCSLYFFVDDSWAHFHYIVAFLHNVDMFILCITTRWKKKK